MTSFNTQPPEGGWLDCSDVAALKNRFQHTAARRRLDSGAMDSPILARFQHTAARRRLGAGLPIDGTEQWFQHTAARRRLVQVVSPHDDVGSVSTHSRPKAAGFGVESTQPPTISFNTQPPEGGWLQIKFAFHIPDGFQHTAARRRLASAARPVSMTPCFNTQPPEGGWGGFRRLRGIWDCFNTQPPEGGWMARIKAALDAFSFNTQPPEGGWFLKTATISAVLIVSTHSRPKAAGSLYFIGFSAIFVSTHSRPKAAGTP